MAADENFGSTPTTRGIPETNLTTHIDAKSVVFEVAEAISLAMDELHFVREALGDAVVTSDDHSGQFISSQR